ncbi:MAG: hypothetical protein COB98_10160 [Flavobacteriaceae bacterium]|nr:MAG: hypothetical protein COB98_10160 [Flavobacteriaceae bacterium]
MSCSKEDDINGVKVKFYNETSFNISELNVGDKNVGPLDKNASTDFFIYEKFGFDTGIPDENCTGKIVDQLVKSYSRFYWCGTEKTFVEEGTYEMVIKLVEIDSIKYFRIDLK